MAAPNLVGNKNGFTLIELAVVIAIMSIVLAAIYAVFASTNRSTTNNEVIAEVMQNLRISIDFMELTGISLNLSPNTSFVALHSNLSLDGVPVPWAQI